jgi:DNA-binding SARP family transcriptional activator
MASTWIQMLGACAIHRADGAVEPLPLNQANCLLGYLLSSPARTHSREALLEFLWPDEDPRATRPRLRQTLHGVRQTLSKVTDPGVLSTDRATVALAADAVPSDLNTFASAMSKSRSATSDEARLEALREAEASYGGELLPGCYHDAVLQQRERLRREFFACLQGLVSAWPAAGQHDRSIDAARRLVSLDPHSEEAHADLIRAFVAIGNRGAALQQCREMERTIREALGACLSESSRALIASVESMVPSAMSEARPPSAPASADVSPVNRGAAASSPVSPGRPRVQLRSRSAWFAVAAVTMLAFFAGRLNHRSAVPPAPSNPSAVSPNSVPALLPMWTTQRDPRPQDLNAEVTAICTDADAGIAEESVYVTGFIKIKDHDVDYLTVKYDAKGRIEWQAYFNGTDNDVDRAHGIALDHDGNVYVTGDSMKPGGNGKTRLAGLDIVTIKYDRNGHPSPTWPNQGDGVGVRRYNSELDGEDYGRKVRVDKHGSVYVVGTTWKPGGRDVVLIKYDRHGDRKWVYFPDHSDRDEDPVEMLLDHKGSVILAYSLLSNPKDSNVEWGIQKVGPDGRRAWGKGWGYRNGFDNRPTALAIAPDDSVVVTGTGLSPDHPRHAGYYFVTRKYASNGFPLWQRIYDGAAKDTVQVPGAIAVDSDGRIFVVGGHLDIDHTGTVVSYTPYGDQVWSDNIAAEGQGAIWMQCRPVPDGRGGVYVFGGSSGFPCASGPGIFLLDYDVRGKRAAAGYLRVPTAGENRPLHMAVTRFGQPIIAGVLNSHGTNDFFAIQFSNLPREDQRFTLPPGYP